jgi:hypothetical protein
MSAINTNGINVNYPTPGVNNDSQGFRDNFTSIKTNLNTTKSEISDLQSKAVVKSALADTTVSNDMGNTLISNAAVRSFRSTTYNIGNSLPSSVTIDVSRGDVQFGTIVQYTTINFGGWAPTGTQSNVQLNLTIANSSATVYFPSSQFNSSAILINGMTTTCRLLENYGSNGAPNVSTTYSNQINVPAGVTELQYKLSTVNCGTTIDIYPLNRNQTTSRIELRTPTNIGVVGDSAGAICSDGSNVYICVGRYDGTNTIWGYVPLYAVGP